MALINTLRNKMGKVVVGLISFAILAFILADFASNQSGLFGNDNKIGEIAGENVDLKEFQSLAQQREAEYSIQYNRQPSERDRPLLRNQAWQLLINKYAFQKQYDEVGTEVTSDEVWDMIQGKNQDPNVANFFTNPETGEFDRQLFLNFYQNIDQQPVMYQNYWAILKQNLRPGRERVKFENLIIKTNYITDAEAEMEYHAQNDVAEIKYLYVPYYAISDSIVNVSDGDLQEYYSKNKEKYKSEHTRSLKYVTFPIVPSAEDSAFVKEDMQKLKEEFKTSKNDSLFAGTSTDGDTFFGPYHSGVLPKELQANEGNLNIGDVKGPYLTNDGYVLYKISDVYQDTVSYAKASHILIKGDTDEAKQKAQDLLNELKGGANFATLARENSEDGSASRGGDLGWFESGKMVPEFEKAVFSANGPGLVNNLVKTKYGYHIIKVDEAKTNQAYKIARIDRSIIASDDTRNTAFSKADIFANEATDLSSFEATAQEKGIRVTPANQLAPNDSRLGVLGEAREVVQWLFRDASKGDVSKVFELDNDYVVAVMTDETEEGYKDIADVKTEITAEVKKQKKGDQIIQKLSGLSGSLDEKASAFGEDANVYSTSNLKLSSNSIPNVGFDPMAVGEAFSLDNGATSDPLKVENGVLIINMQNKTIAPEIADYSSYKTQIEQRNQSRTAFNIGEAIKDDADIEDYRYKFY
ncbi:peptidylprolyl isomerase [Fulvivirga sediminis]|uniref:Periplasmic chaperone PpiD n=1 Tax=Fulvivirga sediminis TaxID=2803949 RepID=A0A937F9Z8_9BACT|nr:peptidylprolyl isomerase [Fulvivirga sediminis]MBL3657019.1 peptidylprolyl isomerase [Fulvivirga sediminis]